MRKRLAALLLLMLTVLPACARGETSLIAGLTDALDSWLIIDADVSLDKRYVHPASFTVPDGYVEGGFSKYYDGVSRDFYLQAADSSARVEIIYVDAASNLTAQEYAERVLSMCTEALNDGTTVIPGEAFSADIAGNQAWCVYLHYQTAQGDYGCLYCAFDAADGICITALLSGCYTAPESVQTAEELLDEARALMAGLTIIR